MLKTVKNGGGIGVDPPLFFQNSHIFPFFFGGSFPYKRCSQTYMGGSAAAELYCSQVSLILPQILKSGRKVVTAC